MTRPLLLCLLAAASLTSAACEPLAAPAATGLTAPYAELEAQDFALDICRRRLAETRAAVPLPGAPDYDAHRAEVLGRAAGEPMVFATEPGPFGTPRDGKHPHAWVQRVERRHRLDKAELRRQILRDGYVFSADGREAFALVRELTLVDLFDAPEVHLMRGETTYRLERKGKRRSRTSYRYTDGPWKGEAAKVLFGDRLAVTAEELTEPRHRDVRSLRDRVGFDRMRIERHSEDAMVAELRFPDANGGAGRWVTALVAADGAHLELACVDAPKPDREAIAASVEARTPRRQAASKLRQAVRRLGHEKPPFDRPRGVKDHLSDGQLRPKWEWAYKRGHLGFTHEEEGYLVFDRQGRPNPPQMCVSFILDAYERASGTWYRPQTETRERTAGGIDFNALGVKNRAGVLYLERWAKEHPELVVASRFEERIPFAERQAYFAYLVRESDRFQPGDIVSIQGPKPDGYVHQHAILVADTDPVTGMPYALADQMKWPRQRTWEAIMAEAPKRALLYHLRPKPELFMKLLGPTEKVAPVPTQVAKAP